MNLSLEQINLLISKVKEAGKLALKLRDNGLEIEKKADNSFVTNADKILDAMLIKCIIEELGNEDFIISEEDVASGKHSMNMREDQNFWLIDPIDGTKSFIKGSDHFSINIAYLEKGVPVFGIIYAPQMETLWYGIVGRGAFKQIGDNALEEIKARELGEKVVLMSSEEQKTPQEFMDKYKITEEIKLPSAIKFCYLAEGRADYYTRKRNKACDWDIAAAHALIVASGGTITFLESHKDFKYGIYPYTSPALLATGKQ